MTPQRYQPLGHGSDAEPPGTGLPGFERFYLNVFFRISTALVSDDAALRVFDKVSMQIFKMIEPLDLGALSEPILIPRLQGIEDSSRHWSVLMVLDHLNRVNRELMSTIRSLHANQTPFREIRIADFKPDPDVDDTVLETFVEVNRRYRNFVISHKPLRTVLRHAHPWFGQLDGHAWNCLAAAHQRIHRRQVQKILSLRGIA